MKIMNILQIMMMRIIPLPRWFPAWKDEGGGAVEASWPEDRAPGDVLGSILYFLEIQGETELFGFLLFLFFIGKIVK